MTKVVWPDLEGYPRYKGEANLKKVCDSSFFYDLPNVPTFVERCRDAAIIVWTWVDITREILDQLPMLKLAVYLGVSVSIMDLNYARSKGITVCNTPGYGNSAVAEHALGLMLALARHTTRAASSMRQGKWESFEGIDLRGSTLGIVGLGGVGSELAAICNALGMNVICYTKHPSSERAVRNDVRFVDLDLLLRTSDFVQLTMISNDETKEMIGAHELDLIKPGAYLINTARSAVIDLNALTERLTDGRLSGYATDVYTKEPTYDEPLTRLNNVIATPHLGFQTDGAKQQMLSIGAYNVTEYLNDSPRNVVI